MDKPITIKRQEYIRALCSITNKADLPAFVIADVLKSILKQAQLASETELKRDEAIYRAAMTEKVKDNGKNK